MTIKPTPTLNLKHHTNQIERTVKSFMNYGRAIADISFRSRTSTGAQGVQYQVKGNATEWSVRKYML